MALCESLPASVWGRHTCALPNLVSDVGHWGQDWRLQSFDSPTCSLGFLSTEQGDQPGSWSCPHAFPVCCHGFLHASGATSPDKARFPSVAFVQVLCHTNGKETEADNMRRDVWKYAEWQISCLLCLQGKKKQTNSYILIGWICKWKLIILRYIKIKT
jgi:hypothetical protein